MQFLFSLHFATLRVTVLVMPPRRPPRRLNHEPAAIRYARKQAGLTQAQVAEQCGVAFSLISEIEKGTRNATDAMLNKLAAVFNCPRVVLEAKNNDSPGPQPNGGGGSLSHDHSVVRS